MSKIQAVNYQQQQKLAQPHANHASAQSFGHGLSDLPKPVQDILTKGVEKKINARLSAPSKFFRWMSGWQGELQSQVINNFFTGTLAYYMIAHNPISKQDEKTKKYTAWRQPISAAIAMTAGFGMTAGINRIMDWAYHEGNFETIDLRLVPGKDYLKRAYKKYCKEHGKSMTRDDYMERVKKERLEVFTKLLSEDPATIKFDEKTKAIMINGKDIQKGHLLRVPGFETQEALDKYVNKNNFQRRTLGNFLEEKFGFEFSPNGELKPRMTDSKLSNIKAMDFLTEIGLVDDKVTETGIKTTLGKYQQMKKIEPSIESWQKIGVKVSEEFAAEQLGIQGKVGTRNLQAYLGEEKGKAKVTTLGQFLHQFDLCWTREDSTKKSLQRLTEMPIEEFVEVFKQHFEFFNLEGFEKGKKIPHFVENMLKNSTKQISENAKNYSKYTGMAFNLITTAISCTILNWAYPRIMERFFPELTKSDKKPDTVKGGNK